MKRQGTVCVYVIDCLTNKMGIHLNCIFRTADLVEQVLQGRNGSVFCYGATGAGKTYTMLGTVENPGVMVLAIKDLFTKIRQRSCDGNHVVHLSYLEVYNESVRDLLSPGRPLVLREDKQVFPLFFLVENN